MATQPTKWTAEPATTADKVVIPVSAGTDDVDMTKLFPSAFELPLDAGGKAVARREMNTLIGELQQNTYFQQQGGVYDYSANIDYTVGTRVLYNGDFYKCIADNGPSGTVADPTNTHYWDRLITKSEFDVAISSAVPVGTILDYGGTTAPSGFLICNGAAVSRTAYSALFSVIGTRFGAGNGSTTFNLPLFTGGQFARGVAPSSVGTKYSASLPPLTASSAGTHTHTRGTMNITGRIQTPDDIQPEGAFYRRGFIGNETGGTGAQQDVGFDAYRSWTGETSSNGAHTHSITNNAGVAMNGSTVLPLSVGILKIIKY